MENAAISGFLFLWTLDEPSVLGPTFSAVFPFGQQNEYWLLRMVYGSSYQGYYLKLFQLFNYFNDCEDFKRAEFYRISLW